MHHQGHSGLVVSTSDCSLRRPKLKTHCGQLCLTLSQQPVRYAALGIGCTPLLQCIGQLKVLHPSVVTISSTSFGWGKDGRKVTLCDPIWHVSSVAVEALSSSGVGACCILQYPVT